MAQGGSEGEEQVADWFQWEDERFAVAILIELSEMSQFRSTSDFPKRERFN